MLQVWFDDSGKGQLPVFVLAGYYGDVSDWVTFSHNWQQLLNKEPRLEYIKGYEAFGLRREFKGWTEKTRDDRLLEFIPLIKSYSGKGLAMTIGHEAFRKIIAIAPGTPFTNPYTFAYNLALATVLPIVLEFSPQDTIDIVFDRDLIKPKRAQEAYEMIPSDLAQFLARQQPRFEDDKNFMPLQAADLLAYCIRVQSDPNPRNKRVLKSPVFDALRSISTAFIQVGNEEMEYLRNRVMGKNPGRRPFRIMRW